MTPSRRLRARLAECTAGIVDQMREDEAAAARAERWTVAGMVLAGLLVAAMLLLASGCRAVPADVREQADLLARDVPMLLDASQAHEGLDAEQIAARAELEERVRAAVATLAERARD